MATTATPAQVPAIPFRIASRRQTRQAFTPPVVALSASASSQLSPIEVPATGYLSTIRLEVSGAWSGGGAGTAFNADAPFNVISSVGVRSADGTPIITPIGGYALYLINKYGSVGFSGNAQDPKNSISYSATGGTATGTFTFFLSLPFEFDKGTGLGSIPALASNRSYVIDVTLAAISTVFGATNTPTGVNLTLKGYSEYWAQPAAANSLGQAQETAPQGLGTLARWQLETPVITAGDKYVKSNNVGGTLRNHILVLRTAAGARTDSDWPTVFQLYLDNEPQFYLTKTYFKDWMTRYYNLTATSLDAVNGLDTGVFVLPYHALLGGVAGDSEASRGQLLNTNSASLLQFYGSSFGASASTLEVYTQTISGAASVIYAL